MPGRPVSGFSAFPIHYGNQVISNEMHRTPNENTMAEVCIGIDAHKAESEPINICRRCES